MKTVWVLVVLVVADGTWREWDHQYSRLEACQEILKTITNHREDTIKARCEERLVQKD